MRRDDLKIASLATVPSRLRSLRVALESLRPQVDDLFVFLNGYKAVPQCVIDLGCTAMLRTDNCGDAGKFFWASQPDAWVLTCDDDFEYRGDYVTRQIDAAMRLHAAVSLHGVVLSDELASGVEVNWLKEGRKHWFRACDNVEDDVAVHVLGTGVGCFHTSMISLDWAADFPEPNSADLYFSAACQRQGVRRFVPQHEPDLAVQIAPPLADGPKSLRWSGEYAARAASLAPWRLHTEDTW